MFYAVRKGITPGIYNSWIECEKQVKGFPGAVFKKFETKDEANYFIINKIVELPKNKLQLWTDGSAKLGVNAGYGFVVVNEDKIEQYSGKILVPPFSAPQAETYAMLKGLQYMESNHNNKDFDIYCDSIFVVNTLKEWGPQRIRSNVDWSKYEYNHILKPLTIWCMEYKGRLTINHVNSHIGLPYNELADKLAEKGRLN